MSAQLTSEEIGLLRDSASKACTLLKALANEDRLLLLCQLTQGERNVGELEDLTGIRQPTLSQQLGVLRDEGMVNTRRMGKYIYYSLASFEVVSVMQTLSGLYCGQALKK
ncbi:MAG TPA: ArsR family transcriptional regulator [Pseudomonas sp.]|jgi:DNA-binding transcriptional ArsR family regulator|uniref:Metalloregulator ArsR/SmtB family transcription factor n=1 Tax=Pseudomonas helleri TaxID=1608996 RepID=A0A0J6I9F0_9PSED|nr:MULTISPECIES: metalloregulator ArsR/SmtB family transcription factor [Pseudomonas]KMN11285.1 ArsR family transcriptional regulator [Pseudomonas helleri]KMN21225.1 ArsR family transcriptional regulator [Pseudomonas helleri]MCU1757209.1 metalloregulator ArsR/SmtB family transcription factor [Pseudomonas helleri]MQT33162.1 metalloregulator ArsR/SmtB family transcription factor [Pseudomonas helleri]MQT36342.1 metalloregulator ArsR/SmtB family transcription factor [Pseudomonas helleri]